MKRQPLLGWAAHSPGYHKGGPMFRRKGQEERGVINVWGLIQKAWMGWLSMAIPRVKALLTPLTPID